MSHDDDIEHTVRLDYNKIKDPYEATDISEDSVDFDKLNAELESISADFSEQPQDNTNMETIRLTQLPDYDTNADSPSDIASDIDIDFASEPDSDIDSLIASDVNSLVASDTSFDNNAKVDVAIDSDIDADFNSNFDIGTSTSSDIDALITSDVDALVASDTSLHSTADTRSNEPEQLPLDSESESNQLPLTAAEQHIDLTSEMMVEKEAAKKIEAPHVIKDEAETVHAQIEKSYFSPIIATCGLIAGLIGIGFGISAQNQTSEVAGQLSLIKISTQPIDYSNKLIDIDEQITQLTSQVHALENKKQAIAIQPVEVTTIPKTALPIAHDNPAKVIKPQTPMTASSKTVAKTDSWNVIVSSHNELNKAKVQQQRLLPMQTEIQPAQVNHKTWYRTVATGFASKAEAVTFISKLKKDGIPDAWLQHQAKGK